MNEDMIYTKLKKIFGYDSFRANQKDIIDAIKNNRDVFAVMPTGAGKSLCYQLPALLQHGVCIVISPLIALMKDQVDNARHAGIKADYINSTQSYYENEEVLEKCRNNKLDLLYVAPERFALPQFIAVLKEISICFFAIDEAHCISEWGHDFRPDYLTLTKIIKQFPDITVTAFTATATQQVQNDIIQKLNLREPFVIRASFNRPNLFYHIMEKNDARLQIFSFVKNHSDEAGIVYRTSRKDVEATTRFLADNGIKAMPYHAGLSSEERRQNQEAFNKDEIQVIVATIAFGMGIDKSNIRFIIHGDLPKSMEGYYQETGRSGRDGEQAHCLLLFSRGDAPKIRYFINQIDDPVEQNRAFTKLDEIINYAASTQCRRKVLLDYFNENYTHENCGMCDICTDEIISVDATRDAQIVLSAIARTDQRFGASYIVDIIVGANTKKIRANDHKSIKTYGIGSGQKKTYWRQLLEELIQQNFISRSNDNYSVLSITKEGRALLKGDTNCTVLQKSTRPHDHQEPVLNIDYNRQLFSLLKQLRKKTADAEGVPPFVIFSDKTLHEMCRYFPQTEEELLRIHGIGETKMTLYGQTFAQVISDFVSQNNIEKKTISLHNNKSSSGTTASSTTREETMQLLQQGLTYIEIAKQRELTPGTILAHMEQLIREGHKIDFATHIDKDRFLTIKKMFMDCNTIRLKSIVEQSKDTVSYDEARLVRMALQSENI